MIRNQWRRCRCAAHRCLLSLSLSHLDELCVHKRSTESQLVTHRCSQRSASMYTVNNLRSSWPCKRHRSSSHAQCTKSKTNCVVAVICVAQLFHHSPRRLAPLFRTSSISQTDLFFSIRPVVHSPLSIFHHHRPSTIYKPTPVFTFAGRDRVLRKEGAHKALGELERGGAPVPRLHVDNIHSTAGWRWTIMCQWVGSM